MVQISSDPPSKSYLWRSASLLYFLAASILLLLIAMNKLAKFILPTVLVALMVLASPSSVFAATELAYDDGTQESNLGYSVGGELAVRFSLQPGWSSAKLLTARYFIYNYPGIFRVHVYGSGVTDPALDVTPSSAGWFDVDLTAYNIVVSGDFYISIEYLGLDPPLGTDTTDPIRLRTYTRGNPGEPWELWQYEDLMIRAVVEPAFAPVGGVLIPVNKLTILAPYLALVGLIGAVTAAVGLIRRRKA